MQDTVPGGEGTTFDPRGALGHLPGQGKAVTLRAAGSRCHTQEPCPLACPVAPPRDRMHFSDGTCLWLLRKQQCPWPGLPRRQHITSLLHVLSWGTSTFLQSKPSIVCKLRLFPRHRFTSWLYLSTSSFSSLRVVSRDKPR